MPGEDQVKSNNLLQIRERGTSREDQVKSNNLLLRRYQVLTWIRVIKYDHFFIDNLVNIYRILYRKDRICNFLLKI